jgi:hypothetical protein
VHYPLVAMIFHLLKASNNEDQMSVAEKRFGGDSVKSLVVGLEGHVIGRRLAACFPQIFIVRVTPF